VKLKRVEIRGFKSIAKKTSLSVADGITCIAGPNGCGKSNIIDAIRWALGEQSNKSLRAGSMSEVIFSGTEGTGPSSMAEVTLEFVRDNGYFPKTLDGFDEISVMRRLFSTGESIYSLNNVRCRLKDIADLFLDTGLDRHGYAIVEQGKVKDIIQSRPEDIRYLIEEAAEVGKFRVKRMDAVRRLEAAAGNLERVRDLLTEVSRQRDELKSQANKARRYQAVRSEINELTKILWAHEIKKITERRERHGIERKEIEQRLDGFLRQNEEYSRILESYSAKLSAIRQKIDDTKRLIQEAHSRGLLAESEIEGAEKRVQDISSTLNMLDARIDQMQRSREDLLKKNESGRLDLEKLNGELSRIEEEVNSRTVHTESTRQEYQRIDGEYNHGRTMLFDAIGHRRAMEQRISSLEARLHEVSTNSDKRREDLSDLAERKAALQSKLDAWESELALKREEKNGIDNSILSLEKRIHSQQSEIEGLSQEVMVREKTHAQILAKIAMLERIIRSSTKPIPQDLTKLNGSKRVADAITVKSGFETVVGRSLGSSLDYLIIKDHKDILEIAAIEDGGPGYIPKKPHINGKNGGGSLTGQGIIAPLRELVEAREGYEDVVHALSQDMLVVEDIQCAVSLWNQGMRSCSLVTKDGAVLEPTGVVRTTVEMEKYAEGLKAKAEKEEISKQKASVEQDIVCLEERLSLLKQQHQGLKEELETARKRERDLKGDIEELAEKRHGEAREMERLSEREKSFSRDIEMWNEMSAKISADLSALLTQKASLDEQIESMQNDIKSLDEERLSAKRILDRAQEEIEAHTVKAGELRVSIASMQERLRGINSQAEDISREIAKDSAQREELRQTRDTVWQSLEKARESLARAREEEGKLDEVLKSLLPEYEDKSDTAASVARDRDECKETIELLEKSKNELLLKDKEQEIALSMSYERFNSRFANETLPDIPGDFNPDEARENAVKLEARIEKMGQINFASLDAYEQVQARWDDLHRQYEDLVQASTRLKEVIANIEKQSMKAFMETFELIRKYFQELFTTIFGGGKADIVLTEGNPLEAGVEILACPPFKKLKSMSLLSEGEKTLCALSFIFALFKVRPSPFCILDEVDAPLDDSNVVRFNRLIRAFSTDSQFIIVTHNRYTMEMADILYGVTFDIPGVSKVVSMHLQDA